jgi:hypothetical protein
MEPKRQSEEPETPVLHAFTVAGPDGVHVDSMLTVVLDDHGAPQSGLASSVSGRFFMCALPSCALPSIGMQGSAAV